MVIYGVLPLIVQVEYMGENSTGELGINGNTTDQTFAVLNPAIPTTCGGSLLPCPLANLGSDRLKCLNESITLLAGANGDTYRYTWFSGPSATGPWTQIGATNQTYPTGASLSVTTPQFYRVRITDSRASVADNCGPCPQSFSVVRVTDRTPPLGTSSAGTCGANVCFDINSTGAIDNNAFDWFATQGTATKLNTSGTINPFCVAQSSLTLSGGNYEVWVEDNRVFQSTVGPIAPPCPAPAGSSGGAGGNKYQQQFVVYRNMTITSLQVYYRTHSVNATPETVNVKIYSNDPNKNSTSNDGVNALTGVVSTNATIPRNSTNWQLFTLNVTLPLTGSPTGTKYWLEVSGISNGVFHEFTCAAAYPYSDAVVGEDVVVIRGSTTNAQVIQQANYNAYAFNWTFTYQGGYPCGRFRLTAPSGTTACPTPVEFLYFQGEHKGGANNLSWATASEKNSDYYNVQRSYDGQSWQSIGIVKAAGNSSSILKYAFSDASYKEDVIYYRLEQVDFDGSVMYSNVVHIGSALSNRMIVRPNPNNGQFVLEASGVTGTEAIIMINDALGRQVYHSKEFFASELMIKEIQLQNFGKGIYFITVTGNGKSNTQKLIIE
ncbi:MAG: T9SS type A sorting domain-containing protein [Cytophagaceae bacterium]